MKKIGFVLMLTGIILLMGVAGRDDLLVAQGVAVPAGVIADKILVPLSMLFAGGLLAR